MSFIKAIIKIANTFEHKIALELSGASNELPASVPLGGIGTVGGGTGQIQNMQRLRRPEPKVDMSERAYATKGAPTLRQNAPAQATTTQDTAEQPTKGPKAVNYTGPVTPHRETKGGGTSLGQIWEAKVNKTTERAALFALLDQRIAEISKQKIDQAQKDKLIQQAKNLISSKAGTMVVPGASTARTEANLSNLKDQTKQRLATRST